MRLATHASQTPPTRRCATRLGEVGDLSVVNPTQVGRGVVHSLPALVAALVPVMRQGGGVWTELARIARGQAGVITTRQAMACGISARTLQRRSAREGWVRLARGVYLLPGHTITPHARLWAASGAITSAHCQDGTPEPLVAVTAWTAAWLREFASRPRGHLEVVVPHDHVAPKVPGIRFIRSRTLRPEDVGSVDGLPVASLARLVIDLAPTSSRSDLRGLLIDARQRRADLDPVIERVMTSTPFPGRRGLKSALREVASDQVDSVFAKLVGDWLRREGFDPVAEYPIETPTGLVHADQALVEDRIDIECDGLGAHSQRASLTTDAKRSNGLALRPDWRVLHMTWDIWEHERDKFLAEVRVAQAAQRQLLEALRPRRTSSPGRG